MLKPSRRRQATGSRPPRRHPRAAPPLLLTHAQSLPHPFPPGARPSSFDRLLPTPISGESSRGNSSGFRYHQPKRVRGGLSPPPFSQVNLYQFGTVCSRMRFAPMRPAPQFVTNRESASGSHAKASLGARRDFRSSLQKTLKNLSVAADKWNTSGQHLRPHQIGPPIAFKAVSGEQLLNRTNPAAPDQYAKLSAREGGVGSNFSKKKRMRSWRQERQQ